MADRTVPTSHPSQRDSQCGGTCSTVNWPEGSWVCSAYNTALDALCTRWWGHDGDHIACPAADRHATAVWPPARRYWTANPSHPAHPAGTHFDSATAPGAPSTAPGGPASARRAPGALPSAVPTVTLMVCCGGWPDEHFATCPAERRPVDEQVCCVVCHTPTRNHDMCDRCTQVVA